MTVRKAKGFVQRWRRVFVPALKGSDYDVVRDMQRGCLWLFFLTLLACGGFWEPAFASVFTGSFEMAKTSRVELCFALLGAGLLVICLWVYFWLWPIRRLFEKAGARDFGEFR